MADFKSGRVDYAPQGKRNILRDTNEGAFAVKSKTVSSAAYPTETIDGFTNQKVLQEGELMAVLTSGAEIGKVVPFQAGATDGRQDLANVVGICKDWFGAQLMDRDVEAAILNRGELVQAWCTERNSAGVRIPLTNASADALRGKKNLQILFV